MTRRLGVVDKIPHRLIDISIDPGAINFSKNEKYSWPHTPQDVRQRRRIILTRYQNAVRSICKPIGNLGAAVQ